MGIPILFWDIDVFPFDNKTLTKAQSQTQAADRNEEEQKSNLQVAEFILTKDSANSSGSTASASS